MNNVSELLDKIRIVCNDILRECLTGVYVHGSIAFGCFTWERSDVDLLIVVNRPLSLSEKKSLLEGLLALENDAPPKGLEMSVVLEQDCQHFSHPMHYELHYSNGHKEKCHQDIDAYCARMNGTDRDLAAHCTVIRQVGQVLIGKPLCDVFSSVPKADYLDSLIYDIENARDDILDNPVYIVLNLCRVLAYLLEEKVLSKQQGGEWGRDNLPEIWSPLINEALFAYAGNEAAEMQRYDLVAFADMMLERLKAAGLYQA